MAETVKIGTRTYTIKYQGTVVDDCLGICYKDKRKIVIQTGQRPKTEFDTVLHEILHAIWHERKLEQTDEIEEKIVSGVASGLTNFFKQNPEFTENLMSLLK